MTTSRSDSGRHRFCRDSHNPLKMGVIVFLGFLGFSWVFWGLFAPSESSGPNPVTRLFEQCSRATVLHIMNITLKLPDDLCREARHRAVDESKSLSAWVADLVAREVRGSTAPARPTLLQMLGDDAVADGEIDLPDRSNAGERPVEFP